MQISTSLNADVATLFLSGRFDFNLHREFRTTFDNLLNTPGVRNIHIDLGKVDYLESSALGMLLLAKELAEGRNMSVQLTHCQARVRDILEIANFGKLFKIS